MAEAQSDPELASAFRERWLEPRRESVREILRAAIAEGSLRADIDFEAAIALLYGSLYYRLIVAAGPIDKRFIDHIYQQFLAGTRNIRTGLDEEPWP